MDGKNLPGDEANAVEHGCEESSEDPAAFCPCEARRALFLPRIQHVGISTVSVIALPRSCPGSAEPWPRG